MAARRNIRPLIVLTLFAVAGVGAAVARGSSPPAPEQVAKQIHGDVTRDVLSRTGDFTATVGPLDCIETKPGLGSCLANFTSSTHRADHLMIAVHYEVVAHDRVTFGVRLP
ncbi:MAG: hypothetical protein PGN13_12160 [Patulibacter minatonensis]